MTVTVFADVTVTVAGPHWSAPEDSPVGELSEPVPPVALPVSPPVGEDTGTGMTVTVEGDVAWVPVPVGPLIPVELPNSYGADVEPIGFNPVPEGMGPPVGTPLGR